MAELTLEEIEWIKSYKAIQLKEKEVVPVNASYQSQIASIREKASNDINVLEAERVSREKILKTELEQLKSLL